MENSIVAVNSFEVTALIHQKSKWKKVFWEATCPELDITIQADSKEEARESLRESVQDFLQDASEKEIASRLEKGTTYFVEPLTLTSIVRADDEQSSWLARVTDSALAVKGTAKEKSGVLATSVVGVAAHSGRFVAGTASNAYGAVGGVASNVYTRTHQNLAEHTTPLLIGLTEHAGVASETLTNNSSLQQIAKTFNLEKWLDVSEHVNIEEAQYAVFKLRERYPEDSSRQIAKRLITEKAVYAGGVGLSTSLLPGAAVPLLALDMAATAFLQAELILQIAAAYELDLEDPARKGEMLAVFGCVLGGSKAVKAGLGILRNAPVAGAIIGATSNAVMIYALGNVACNFYEKRLDLAATAEAMEEVKEENALYLEASVDQQVIADQVLMHVLLAGNPNASEEEVVNALRAMNFNPTSIEAIENNLNSPKSLDELLPLLDAEFGDYVSLQARQIALMDDVITAEEAKILKTINDYFANRLL